MTSTAEQPSTTLLQQQPQQQRDDGLTTEEIQEKMEVVTSLEKHVLDLQNVLNMNDEILKENSEIDQSIYTKEKMYGRLVEQNREDMIQLELEKPSQLEAFAYELSIMEAKLDELRRLKVRYDEIESENESLRSTFADLSEEFSNSAKKYADEMHKLNKGMQSMRQEIENIFNKKLIDMDVKFQDQAFANLNDRKKKELLDHSKLQDEIAMQENGLSNLMIRISRGKNNFANTKKNIKRLNKRASAIRSKLKEYRLVKSIAEDKLQTCHSEISELNNDSTELLKLLTSWPYIEDMENALMKCEKESKYVNEECSRWQRRLNSLREIEADFRSLRIRRKNAAEARDKSSVDDSVCNNHKNVKYAPGPNDDCDGRIYMSDVRAAIDSTNCMQEILEPLMGKENLLALCQGSTDVDRNPLAWLMKSVLNIWDVNGGEISGFGDDLEDSIPDKNEDDMKVSGEVQEFQDSLLEDEYERSDSNSNPSMWLKSISEPKLFPDDVATCEERNIVSSVDAPFKAILKDVEDVWIPSPRKVSHLSIPPIRSSSDGYIGNTVGYKRRKKKSMIKKTNNSDGTTSTNKIINKSLSTNVIHMKTTRNTIDVSATMQ